MKVIFTVALSVLAGIVIGGSAVQRLNAQTKPPAYIIGEIDVADPENYAKEYLHEVKNRSSQTAGANSFHAEAKQYRLEVSSPKRIVMIAFEKFLKGSSCV